MNCEYNQLQINTMSSISAFEIMEVPFFAYVFRNTTTKSWLTMYENMHINV